MTINALSLFNAAFNAEFDPDGHYTRDEQATIIDFARLRGRDDIARLLAEMWQRKNNAGAKARGN